MKRKLFKPAQADEMVDSSKKRGLVVSLHPVASPEAIWDDLREHGLTEGGDARHGRSQLGQRGVLRELNGLRR